MREKDVGWMLREIAVDRQTKGCVFTVPKHHRIQSKLDKGRFTQLRLDFVADYSLICRPMCHVKY